MLSARDALTADQRAAASAEIARRVEPLLAGRGTVALYAPKASEVDTAAIDAAARAARTRVVYPRMQSGERRLAFCAVRIEDHEPARFGLREPRADAPAVAIDEIDAFVLPGVAFDRAGHRVGWGRGHYDATLAAAPAALRVGVGFACQVIDAIEHDPHDQPVHYIVTETETVKVAA